MPSPKITQKSNFKKINYKYVGKESLSEIINRKFPKQLIPSKRINTFFGLIFIAVLIITGIQFPFRDMAAGNTDIIISVGYPLHFLEFDLTDKNKSPSLPLNLVLDLFLYLILAYAIDIIINLILKNPLVRSKKKIKQQPTVFKNQKSTITEKILKNQQNNKQKY